MLNFKILMEFWDFNTALPKLHSLKKKKKNNRFLKISFPPQKGSGREEEKMNEAIFVFVLFANVFVLVEVATHCHSRKCFFYHLIWFDILAEIIFLCCKEKPSAASLLHEALYSSCIASRQFACKNEWWMNCWWQCLAATKIIPFQSTESIGLQHIIHFYLFSSSPVNFQGQVCD